MEVPKEEGFYWALIPTHRPSVKVVEVFEDSQDGELQVQWMFADEGHSLDVVKRWIARIDPPTNGSV